MNSLSGISATPGDSNPERIQIQVTKAQAPQFQHTVGDTFASIEGYIAFDRGLYELRLVNASGASRNEQEIVAISVAPADDVLTVAGYNVENLDPVLERVERTPVGDPDDDVSGGKFSSIADHVVRLLGSPDILALQEVQDNDGGEYSEVVASDVTLTTLIDAIIDAGGPRYEPLSIDPIDDTYGGQPGGNIRVADLFNRLVSAPTPPVRVRSLRRRSAEAGSRSLRPSRFVTVR
ncbi:hypothetical protein [Mesorhizobium sp. WSM2239]|uniref:Endonuclease/exonuclease/phosphatase domain-containing protein n=2 Tax=unclassified Mesorhizobium TaxID=325217 RepID=A0AAU8D678_9HYPH